MKQIATLKTIGLSFALVCSTSLIQLQSVGHKLTSPMMMGINLIIKKSPLSILEIEISLQRLKKVSTMTSLPKNKTVQDIFDPVFAPVQHLFELLTEHATQIQPLVQESMKLNKHGEKSLLNTLFQSKTPIDKFCKTTIISWELFKQFGIEVTDFFNDLNASLSEDTLKSCNDLREKIKNTKKK